MGILEAFRVFGISFLLLGGFGTLWVGGPPRGFRKYLILSPSEQAAEKCLFLHKTALQITIRNARITILIRLEYFDVMDMKSLQKIIPPEFSDVMIASVVGGEARDANPTITRNNSARMFLM